MADIGSLVVKLAAETAEFREDLGKSAHLLEKHAESMRGSLERVAEVAKTTFAIAIGVESVGALKELIAHTLETVAALQDLAEQTGASATALSGFAPVATISGVAMEQIGVGLTKLSKGLAGVDDETKGAAQALHFLGEITGQVTNNEILGNIFSKFKVFAHCVLFFIAGCFDRLNKG